MSKLRRRSWLEGRLLACSIPCAAILCLAIFSEISLQAADDSKTQWHLYTGYQNKWVAVSQESQLPFSELGKSIPDFDSLQDGKLKWVSLPSGMSANVKDLGLVNGRKLWQVTYRDSDQKTGLPSSVVFWLANDESSKTALPFFAYDFDPTTEKSWGSQLVPTNTKGISLEVTISVQGQGQIYGVYSFSFAHGRPHFVSFSEGDMKGEKSVEQVYH